MLASHTALVHEVTAADIRTYAGLPKHASIVSPEYSEKRAQLNRDIPTIGLHGGAKPGPRVLSEHGKRVAAEHARANGRRRLHGYKQRITPEAKRARALKGWETRRARA